MSEFEKRTGSPTCVCGKKQFEIKNTKLKEGYEIKAKCTWCKTEYTWVSQKKVLVVKPKQESLL
jgi:hypothetical protein